MRSSIDWNKPKNNNEDKNQFAFGPVTSRNGNKITIALFNDYKKALISQAYIPFEIKNKNELDAEYLMMWFRRPEFDRYARFKSHGSAREIFDWEEMCNVTLPIPSITKQKEIVKEYNVIQNRIALNQQLILKLEETAQAIYKADSTYKCDISVVFNCITKYVVRTYIAKSFSWPII